MAGLQPPLGSTEGDGVVAGDGGGGGWDGSGGNCYGAGRGGKGSWSDKYHSGGVGAIYGAAGLELAAGRKLSGTGGPMAMEGFPPNSKLVGPEIGANAMAPRGLAVSMPRRSLTAVKGVTAASAPAAFLGSVGCCIWNGFATGTRQCGHREFNA